MTKKPFVTKEKLEEIAAAVGFTPEDICGRIEEYYRKQGQEER